MKPPPLAEHFPERRRASDIDRIEKAIRLLELGIEEQNMPALRLALTDLRLLKTEMLGLGPALLSDEETRDRGGYPGAH